MRTEIALAGKSAPKLGGMESESDLQRRLAELQQRLRELEQQNSDLEIALETAIEHGDAIDREISATNRRLVGEIAERVRAEARLERLLEALRQQKADLEILVATVSEHSDGIDADWLRRYAEAETTALTDELTGLANRRGLNLALDRSWRRCLRTGSSLALLMIDIDYFKSYNDAHGHLAGDKCLGLLAQILKRACGRPDDLAARYGGEEFVLVLPETDLPGACRVAERIQKELTACALPHPGSGFGLLTISVGVSARVPSAEHDVAALLAEADRLLYVAKREGRNTLRSA
ncbi:Phytochrome-like protein cph2 [Burkholderiales bacterium]|nr:Phytochrome-like protein cph2 [Burkholderiales bacterium]